MEPPTASLSAEEVAHLERARALGRRGWGRVHPNPLVGCVIIRDGRTVGEGYHEVFGGPHAEIAALEQARGEARGATAYISLEPCNHHGKTPPCSQALLDAGVRRVVFGARDPDPEAAGGADAMRQGGIEVVGPVWSEREGRAENPAFFHAATRASPFVALKLAMSLDARIAVRKGERTQITGPEAEREVHRLRSGFEAIMVGAGTARVDDPRLTPRLAPTYRSAPGRIILDSDASVPSDAAVFDDLGEAPIHVFVRTEAPESAIERLEEAGAHVHPVRRGEDGLSLDDVLEVSWDIGIRSILCEGGSRLGAELLRERRVHRLYLFVAPITLGAAGVPAFPDDAQTLDWAEFEPALPPELHGRDVLMVLDRQQD